MSTDKNFDHLHKSSVPLYFHVPYVEKGYRHINQTWLFYVYSIFRSNMECINVWTHVIGAFVMLMRWYEILSTFEMTSPDIWPLLASILTFFIMFVTSFTAHMFSHKSMEVNCVMFMADFASIGLYGYGTIINHYYYSLDRSFSESFLQQNAISLGFVLAVVTCVFGSVSKVIIYDVNSRNRTCMIVSSIGSVYLISNIPVLHRMWNNEQTDGITYHLTQIMSMLSVCFFYSTKIPERLSPGTFDFVGNSHQIFHIFLVLCTQSHIDGVVWDLKFRKTFLHLNHIPSAWNTFGAVFILILVDVLIITIFYSIFRKRVVCHEHKS